MSNLSLLEHHVELVDDRQMELQASRDIELSPSQKTRASEVRLMVAETSLDEYWSLGGLADG